MTGRIDTIKKRVVYENDFVVIHDDDVRFPSGTVGRYYYPQWKSPHGVAILTVVDNCVLLLRNYRYAEQDYSLEIPQGFGIEGFTPEQDARRELLEETGLEPVSLKPLVCFGSLYKTHLFLWCPVSLPTLRHDGQELTEAITGYELLPLEGISLTMLDALGIHDPITISALMIALSLSNNNLLVE